MVILISQSNSISRFFKFQNSTQKIVWKHFPGFLILNQILQATRSIIARAMADPIRMWLILANLRLLMAVFKVQFRDF